jgi:hypothetical protein
VNELEGVWTAPNDYQDQWVFTLGSVYAVITFIDRDYHVFELELTVRGRTVITLHRSIEDAFHRVDLGVDRARRGVPRQGGVQKPRVVV